MAALAVRSGIAFLYIAALYFRGGCPIGGVLGRPCPTCGITRACRFALLGDWNSAFAAHPLWPVVPGLWLLICLDATDAASPWKFARQMTLVVIGLLFGLRWFG